MSAPSPREVLERLREEAASRLAAIDGVGLGSMFDAKLEADAARDGSAVVVSGTTALPDGTFIKYEVSGGGILWGLVLGHRRMGRVRVKDGRFAVRFDPAPWKGPVIDVAVSILGNREQPKATRELIGDRGERLRFSDVAGYEHAEHFLVFRKRIGPRPKRRRLPFG